MPESLTPELIALRDRATQLAEETLGPLQARVDAGEITRAAALADVRAASKQAGLFSMTQPAEFGGNPADALALTMLRDTLAGYNNPLSGAVFGPAPGALAGCGEPLRSTHLLPLLAGERRSAFAITEPGDAAHHTRANADGEELIVNGRKSYVTGGADADFFITLTEVNGGRALVVIDRSSAGVIIERRFESLDGSHHAALRFEEVHVPAGHVIGDAGEGMSRAMRQIGDTRLAIASRCVGLCRWTLQFLDGNLMAPHRSGAPLGDREGVRLRYADQRLQTFAARSMLYRTARLADAGRDIRNEGMACKIFATETLSATVDTAIQLTGGQALTVGHPLEQLYRQVRSLRLAEGANDILRINLARGALEFGQGFL